MHERPSALALYFLYVTFHSNFMDKKNTLIGMGLLALAFLASFWQNQQDAKALREEQSTQKDLQVLEKTVEGSTSLASEGKPLSLIKTEASSLTIEPLGLTKGETYTLENDKIIAQFSSLGGGITHVALKDYPAVQGETAPSSYNQEGAQGLLDICLKAGNGLSPLGGMYELASYQAEKGHILFRYTSPEGLEILRGYSIAKEADERDPYLILHETKWVNHSNQPLSLHTVFFNLGTIPPVEGDQTGEFLNFGYFNGKDAEFVPVHDFQDSSGFFGIGKRKAVPYVAQEGLSIEWGALKNQFFTCVLTPGKAANSFFVQSKELNSPYSGRTELALNAAMGFNFETLAAQESRSLAAECYVGPKEYARLEQLGKQQDLIMQFGFFGFISKLLLALMTSIHSLIPNYGVAIILVTCIIKLLLWPLTATSVRSSRRMAALQEPLKVLREKFKDNPQRMQQETMKLFKEHRVNPAAGCLPILVQIPIFLALFWMLRSASELRFAGFLWIPDLSLPDTVAHIYGIPLNILPLFMGVTMVLQMRFSPSPSTDPLQKKLFQFMPFLFLVICYNFPSGLVLYWTVQNLLTILQQALMRREKLPDINIQPPSKQWKKKKFATS